MKAKLPDIGHMRGMSDPGFYAFDTIKAGGLVGHGVIFTSLTLPGSATYKIFDPDDDPRMQHFVNFIKANTLKEDYELINKFQAKMLQLCDAFNRLCKGHTDLSDEKLRRELEATGELIDKVKAEIAEIERNK